MSLPQRSAAPTLARPAAYGQRPYAGSVTVSGPTGQHSMGSRPMAVRLTAGHPMPATPVTQRPAPRAVVSFLTVTEVAAICGSRR